MAVCAIPQTDGTLVQVAVATPSECTGFLLLTPEDKLAILETIFDPAYLTAADYETVFWFGFTLPLLAYIVSWGYQTVISFIDKES